jgi:acyl transferase domain-containing protein
MPSPLDVAVVGMAALFPGAPDLAAYWRNLKTGVDAIGDVPPGRWDSAFYDPAAHTVDRLYCKRGGFVDPSATFDALGFGVMPVAARGAEPDQLLTLAVAARAMADAGYDARPFERERAGVILGRGNYAGAGRTRLEQHIRAAEQLVQCLRTLLPAASEDELARVKKEFQGAAPAGGADSAIGLVPNLTASRIAHQLDMGGAAYTIDAACASSLVAIDQACHDLASGRSDFMLAGGVHLCHDETFWSVFCQLGAISRSQQIRPFDRRADGLLIGEGIGVVVLKRRQDAERDGDRIYAVVRGTGVASDGREASLMAPRAEGQMLAIRRAWQEAQIEPGTVGLLEAHGTATPAGDATELDTLRRSFGELGSGEPRATMGSVKSMIGHTMPAAGVAGFIKSALAIHHRVLPPTLHCEEPHAALAATRFRAVGREEPWEKGQEPLRAAVNAFGFGGINAHVVLEEHAPPARPAGARAARAASTPVRASDDPKLLVLAAATKEALLADLRRGARRGALEGAARLAIVNPSPERIARAQVIVEKGRPWRGREQIWFTPSGLVSEGGKVALLFPGVDASFEPKVDDVAERFGLPVPPCTVATNLEEVGLGIVGVNRLLDRVLGMLGVKADLIAGHSIGEWSGMIASGLISDVTADRFIASLRPGSLEVPGVLFAAAGCSEAAARDAMRGLAAIDISHDNCPHQILMCGRADSIDTALDRLREAGVLCQKLPFKSGFHSPLFADFLAPHRVHFEGLELGVPIKPLWSATTCAPYPQDPNEIRALAIDHLVRPVRFRELLLALYEQGARVFVQVGTGSVAHFVEDTLRGRPHVAISANVKDQTGMEQLRRMAATLLVEGVDMRVWDLFAHAEVAAREPMRLELGVPLVHLKTPLALAAAPPAQAAPSAASVAKALSGPLAAEFAASLAAVARAQSDVFTAFERAPSRAQAQAAGPREATFIRTLSIETFPEVRDHTFFRQPPGWPTLSDLHPVVPMTTSIELMKEAAQELVPERTVIALEGVRAYRWLVVAKPVDAEIHARFDGKDKVSLAIEGYAEATAILGDGYPPAPEADVTPLEDAHKDPLTGAQMYEDRWMFHGPEFQGIVDVGVLAKDGIRGVLATPAAKGALLDNAGQLFGYWVMRKSDHDRLAMPVRIDKVLFFGPHPAAGQRLNCTVRIKKFEDREVVADLSLDQGGRVWTKIVGWEDRRFDTDDRLWSVMLFPEKNLLAEPQTGGYVVLHDRYRSAPTRDQLARRFLGEAERAEYDKQGPRKQRAWLAGRIAAKDAVRDLLWREGHGPLFPVEVTIETTDSGRPRVRAPSTREVHVSIAHKDEIAVAIASTNGEVGVDVERIEPRPDGFVELAFSDEEVKMIGTGPGRAEGITRLWVAKEAAAKAAGTGLQGDPKRFRVTDRAGDRLLVSGGAGAASPGQWVTLHKLGDYVIGWTQP